MQIAILYGEESGIKHVLLSKEYPQRTADSMTTHSLPLNRYVQHYHFTEMHQSHIMRANVYT